MENLQKESNRFTQLQFEDLLEERNSLLNERATLLLELQEIKERLNDWEYVSALYEDMVYKRYN